MGRKLFTTSLVDGAEIFGIGDADRLYRTMLLKGNKFLVE
jgi:hypothetical protein